MTHIHCDSSNQNALELVAADRLMWLSINNDCGRAKLQRGFRISFDQIDFASKEPLSSENASFSSLAVAKNLIVGEMAAEAPFTLNDSISCADATVFLFSLSHVFNATVFWL